MQCLASGIMNTQTAWLPYLTVKFLLINEMDRQFVLFFQRRRSPETLWGPGKLPQLPPFWRVWWDLKERSELPQWGPGQSLGWKTYFKAFLHHRNCICWHQILCFCCVKCKLSKHRIYRTFSQNIGQNRTLFVSSYTKIIIHYQSLNYINISCLC